MNIQSRTRSVATTVAWIACIAVSLCTWVGCAKDATRAPIRVGIAVPLSGSGAVLGQQIRMGAGLAMIQRNAQGGIDGRRIELVLGDDRDSIYVGIQSPDPGIPIERRGDLFDAEQEHAGEDPKRR